MAKTNLDSIDKKILRFLIQNARTPFLEIARECGISGAAIHQRIKKLEDMGVASPVTAVECKYKVSTTFADLITIFVEVEEFKGVKLKLKYEMKKDDVLVCEGHSEHCFLNTEGNLINLRREYPEFHNTLTSLVGGEEC